MPDVLTLPPTGGSRAVVRRIVEVLAAEELVAIPAETGYLLCGAGGSVAAARRLAALSPEDRLSLCVIDSEHAEDFAPPDQWTPAAVRLTRRCWPGPLACELQGTLNHTLAEAWPAELQERLTSGGWLRLVCDAQPLLREVQREAPWPLVAAASGAEGAESRLESIGAIGRRWGDQVRLLVDAGPPRYQDRSTTVRFHADRFEVTEEGIIGRRTLAQLASRIILFVCTGNTCRSPMAEVLFRHLLTERLECGEEDLLARGFLVLSAGLATTPGMPASQHAVDLMREAGLDLTGHHSQPATPELLGVADEIITMTRSHRDSIGTRFPELLPRVRLLSAEGRDVFDPFGGDRGDYVRCREEIEGHLHRLVDTLLKGAP